jgi:SAM-dependent methyltransferase
MRYEPSCYFSYAGKGVALESDDLKLWFEGNKALLENAYVAAHEPWQQSGLALKRGGSAEEWEAKRRVIADCVNRPGSFLDIGCANGYLLECLLRWVGERRIEIEPYGLDLSEKLATLARQRLPEYAQNIFVENGWDWVPPRRFDYVRTELVNVPDHLQSAYVARILDLFLAPGGRLLAAEYRGREHAEAELTIDKHLSDLGFMVEEVKVACWQGIEHTWIALLRKPESGYR